MILRRLIAAALKPCRLGYNVSISSVERPKPIGIILGIGFEDKK